MSDEHMWRRIEILTECTGEFDVLQSENGDKSTGVVWSTRSATNTPERIQDAHTLARESLREEVRDLLDVVGRGMNGERKQGGM
jgi:hypothetical protein